ncbi:unnamed protein product [Thlaspi arvense]|uniref:histone acetyltransferase n=1 Tax=Thlaspi arvense TaxID=13288 RepID=A0AAU9R3N6_THLAR|nr:unnamed protein product [Thlaspi arvense]
MVDVSRPNNFTHHLPTSSLPFAASANPYGVVSSSMHPNPNPVLTLDPTFTSNLSNPQPMPHTPLLNHHHHHLGNQGNFAQARPPLFHQQAQRQHSQQPLFYPAQLQNQHQLQYDQTQLAPPLKHGLSLDVYKEALQKQAINGFIPSKLNPGAQIASTQLPHPPSASVLVPTQPALQNSTNNHGERRQQDTGASLCPMQPQVVHPCSSARAPIIAQTAESKRLPDASSCKQVNGDDMQQIRWLLLLIHARYCSAEQGKCKSEFCLPVQKLWEHMKRCKVPDCTYPRCPKTRRLLIHYTTECRNKSCPVCVRVKKFIMKHKRRPSESISVDEDLQPPVKRLKIEQPETETESISVSVCGHASSIGKQERDGLQSDDYKSVRVEVRPMDVDAAAEDIPKGRDDGESAMDDKKDRVEVRPTDVDVAEDIPNKSVRAEVRPMDRDVAEDLPKGSDGDEKNACLPKEENVDASKMEISSLVELFTPEQVKEHIRGLRQWVGQSKTKAEKNKAMGGSISANACQLCAVERLVFEPLPIYCSPCGVRIKRNAFHYSVAAGESWHYVCATCYNESRENSVSVDGTCIPKARLEKKKNDEQVGEGWVQCDKCQAWQHQICALFNSRRNHGEATKYTCPSCYIQEVEQGERRPLPQSTIPGAKSLPVTSLSNHIEQRLFKNLKKERQERARLEGKSYEEVPGAESLSVRVVASVDKVLEVKEHFLELFREENYPSEFPYKSKAILLFQKIESVEVCLFGMFVQEFGAKCGPPNQRRVYLSYLDSVKYFRPEVRTVSGEALRTFVYHEILIGYLDYCKKRGFTSCYIWACPPLKGEDYILYCHPEIQKTPKTDKLREWYLAMLRKASEEDVVVECTNLYDHFFVQPGECRADVTAARLPYFDGDYWPGAAEDLIKQMSQEGDGGSGTKLNRTKKVISKRALRAVGQLDLSVNASKDLLMMQKLGQIICPMKEDFIMVHLQHSCKHCCSLMVSGNRWVCNHCKNFQICDKCNQMEQKRAEKERHPINQKVKHTLSPVAIKGVPFEIEDEDGNIESEFFDNRQAFLSLCQGNNYQYDTLRRAKHSSMMILYHLHNPSAPAFATTCTICQQEVENSQIWHCQVCTGYDVCNACYPKASTNHSHKLISRSSATETSVQQNGQANQTELEKARELLVHAIACRSPKCLYGRCQDMKRLFRHCVACKIGAANCRHCKSFGRLLKLHARCCRDPQCTVPKCRDFRAISSRQQRQSDKRRRAAVMEMMQKRAAEATQTCS